MQLHQPLASPSWLLPLNKCQPSGLQQFANSIMKESYQPFPTAAKKGRLSEKLSEKGREAVVLPRGKWLAKHFYLLLEQPFSDSFFIT